MPARIRFILRLLSLAIIFSLGLAWLAAERESHAEETFASASSSAKESDAQAAALAKSAPQTVSDLEAIQDAIERAVKKNRAATVGIEVGDRWGSGVIVSADGFVLTVAHMFEGVPGNDFFVHLSDGRRLRAKVLGTIGSSDAGMMRIIEPGPWPHAEMGRSGALKLGEWCVSMGYPGGYERDHPATVRAGRVIAISDNIWTDCPLIAGDSGGPLFDSRGRLIGIHTGIDDPLVDNFHVPIDIYYNNWGRLAGGDRGSEPRRGDPVLGISGETNADGCQILTVVPGGAGDKAGLKTGDTVTQLAGEAVDSIEALQVLIGKHKVGDEVTLLVARNGEKTELTATLSKRE